jgi:hypothetical protein
MLLHLAQYSLPQPNQSVLPDQRGAECLLWKLMPHRRINRNDGPPLWLLAKPPCVIAAAEAVVAHLSQIRIETAEIQHTNKTLR